MPSDRWTGGGSLFDFACLKLLLSCCDSAVVCADLISATNSGQKADLLWNFHSMYNIRGAINPNSFWKNKKLDDIHHQSLFHLSDQASAGP